MATFYITSHEPGKLLNAHASSPTCTVRSIHPQRERQIDNKSHTANGKQHQLGRSGDTTPFSSQVRQPIIARSAPYNCKCIGRPRKTRCAPTCAKQQPRTLRRPSPQTEVLHNYHYRSHARCIRKSSASILVAVEDKYYAHPCALVDDVMGSPVSAQ